MARLTTCSEFAPLLGAMAHLLVCHGGHLVDVLHAPQRQGSLGDEYSPLTLAALLEGGRVPSMTREYKLKSC